MYSTRAARRSIGGVAASRVRRGALELDGPAFASVAVMIMKLAIAAVLGALSGMVSARLSGAQPWEFPEQPTVETVRVVARVEAAWHVLRHQREP